MTVEDFNKKVVLPAKYTSVWRSGILTMARKTALVNDSGAHCRTRATPRLDFEGRTCDRRLDPSVVNATSCQLLWWGSQSVTGFLLGVLADGFVLAVYENSQQILASASWVILVMFDATKSERRCEIDESWLDPPKCRRRLFGFRAGIEEKPMGRVQGLGRQ